VAILRRTKERTRMPILVEVTRTTVKSVKILPKICHSFDLLLSQIGAN
jgi:hypothetical protein